MLKNNRYFDTPLCNMKSIDFQAAEAEKYKQISQEKKSPQTSGHPDRGSLPEAEFDKSHCGRSS